MLKEILDIPDNIPGDLLNKAECVAIFPLVLKFAIGIGGSYGRGVMTCRRGDHYTGSWSAPSMTAPEGANIGLQLGGTATDVVLLAMNPHVVPTLSFPARANWAGTLQRQRAPKGERPRQILTLLCARKF